MRLLHERVKPGYFPGHAVCEPLVSYECPGEGRKNKDNTDADSETGNSTSIGCKAEQS